MVPTNVDTLADYDHNDPQKLKVYEFEESHLFKHGCLSHIVTIDEANIVVRALYERLHVNEIIQLPIVKPHNEKVNTVWISSEDDDVVIRCPEDKPFFILELLHEIAHHLTDVEMQALNNLYREQKTPDLDYQDHGPEFLCNYFFILKHHFEIPFSNLRKEVINYNKINKGRNIRFKNPRHCFWNNWADKTRQIIEAA